MKLRDLVMPYKLAKGLDRNIVRFLNDSTFVYVNNKTSSLENVVVHIYTRELVEMFADASRLVPAPTMYELIELCDPEYVSDLLPGKSQKNMSSERYWKVIAENLSGMYIKEKLLISPEGSDESITTYPESDTRITTGALSNAFYSPTSENQPDLSEDF